MEWRKLWLAPFAVVLLPALVPLVCVLWCLAGPELRTSARLWAEWKDD